MIFNRAYESGHAPWDTGKVDSDLIQIVTATPIEPCKVLEIGCGTGDNLIWLSQNNFDTTGIDTSEIAIEKAKEKASTANVRCTLMVLDFLVNKIEGLPFGFVFDRGCLHLFGSNEERKAFAENVAAHLEEDGLWLTILGNADSQRNRPGPPQRTARDIVNAVEPCFEILSLVSVPTWGRAWVCLMRKRRLT